MTAKTTELFLHWSTHNKKLKKLGAIAFGIPAFRSKDGFITCPNAGICASICYARVGTYLIKRTQESREGNLGFIRQHSSNEFIGAVVHDLGLLNNNLIRIHDSGDFFSQEYFDSWMKIVRIEARRTFYAYTKSFHLNLWNKLPVNMVLVQSLGAKEESNVDMSRAHARIFSTPAQRTASGYSNGSMDEMALSGEMKIGQVYHGRRFMTQIEKERFGAI